MDIQTLETLKPNRFHCNLLISKQTIQLPTAKLLNPSKTLLTFSDIKIKMDSKANERECIEFRNERASRNPIIPLNRVQKDQ